MKALDMKIEDAIKQANAKREAKKKDGFLMLKFIKPYDRKSNVAYVDMLVATIFSASAIACAFLIFSGMIELGA